MLKVTRFLLAPVAAAVLAACAVGPNYHAPETRPAETFDGVEPATFSPQETVEQFWRTFGDPALDQMVSDARTANYDLRIALSRVNEARALRRDDVDLLTLSGTERKAVDKICFCFGGNYLDELEIQSIGTGIIEL